MIDIVEIDVASRLLTAGTVVAVPTDTVYGLAASFSQPFAIDGLFVAKERPRDVALPVMIADVSMALELGATWSDEAAALADAFWPGALTIVVEVPRDVAAVVGADQSLGFRIPGHERLRDLVRVTGPLAVTSANRHGHPPCTRADEVQHVFSGTAVAGVIDGGACSGEVSTVVDLTDGWRIRRHGAISESALSAILGPRID